MSVQALALQHKRALIDLSTLTQAELAQLWARLAGASADEIRDALLEILPALGERFGDMAGALAADFYDDVRAEVAARGVFVAEPAPLPGTARYDALVRWGVDPLYRPVPDAAAALSKLSGGLSRVVLGVARDTVADAAVRDPQASGWRRVTSPGACRFCRMLAERGAVYKDSTVRFASHDDCGCAAAPAFGDTTPLGVMQYVASKRDQSERDRARVRQYLASMPD